jgi:putative transcriptional regulator
MPILKGGMCIMYKPSYKPLWKTMIDQEKRKGDLVKDLNLSSSTVAKMTANQFVSMQVIAQLCEYLKVNVEEIVKFEPGD